MTKATGTRSREESLEERGVVHQRRLEPTVSGTTYFTRGLCGAEKTVKVSPSTDLLYDKEVVKRLKGEVWTVEALDTVLWTKEGVARGVRVMPIAVRCLLIGGGNRKGKRARKRGSGTHKQRTKK